MSYHGNQSGQPRSGAMGGSTPTPPASTPPAPPAASPPIVPPDQVYEQRVLDPLGVNTTGAPLRERLGITGPTGSTAGSVARQIFRNTRIIRPDGIGVSLDVAPTFYKNPRAGSRTQKRPVRFPVYRDPNINLIRNPRTNKTRKRQASPIHIDGYFPLYIRKEDAVNASPTPTEVREGEFSVGYHVHVLRGKAYYMPNGLVMDVTMFHGNYPPPLQQAGPFTVQGTATNDAPYKGEYGYYYPLWTSGALADQANANTQGGVHEHTFAEFPNVVFYMPNDQANHAVSKPGPYKLYLTDDGVVENKTAATPSNIPQILSTPIRFQIVNLDATIKKKDEFLGGGTAAADPTFFVNASVSPKTGATTNIVPTRLSSIRSSLFSASTSAVNAVQRISESAKVSKADITPTTKVASANPEINNATKTTINGATTTVVGPNGIIQDAQLITFMSGSNIRLDTSGENKDVIRISVDDIFLSELQDVDINMQPTQGQLMVFDTALGTTGITGAFRSVSFATAFTGDTLQVAGLSASGAVTGSSMTLTGSQGIVFQDGTIQTTAAYQSALDFEAGVAYPLTSTSAGVTNENYAYLGNSVFVGSIGAGHTDIFYAGFSGEAGASGAGNYFLGAKAGDHLHVVGQDSGAKIIGRLSTDTIPSSSLAGVSAHGLPFQVLVGNTRIFTNGERINAFYTVGGDTVLSFNGATGDVTGVASFNGSTGAVTGVASVNGSTGAITDVALTTQTVSSFNGSTGAVTGVSTFNGLSGAVTGVASVNLQTGAVTGIATTSQTVASFNGSTGAVTGVSTFNGSTGAIIGVSSVNGSTGAVTVSSEVDANVATFTVSSKGAISVGAKTNSLHRLPYDATLTGIEIITNNTGGFSAGVVASGSTLGSPTQSSITGCTLGISGTSGTSTIIESGLASASITSGNFLYLQIFNNAAGATNAQVFAKYTRR